VKQPALLALLARELTGRAKWPIRIVFPCARQVTSATLVLSPANSAGQDFTRANRAKNIAIPAALVTFRLQARVCARDVALDLLLQEQATMSVTCVEVVNFRLWLARQSVKRVQQENIKIQRECQRATHVPANLVQGHPTEI